MRTFQKALVFAILTTTTISVVAQLPPSQPKDQKDTKKSGPPTAPADVKTDVGDDTQKSSGNAFVIACDAKPGQVLVLDTSGKWLSGVKEIDIKFEIGKEASITCTIYEGVLRPSRPITKTWILAQMKTVSSTEFQKMVDLLQKDPDAIKSLLKE